MIEKNITFNLRRLGQAFDEYPLILGVTIMFNFISFISNYELYTSMEDNYQTMMIKFRVIELQDRNW